MATPVQARCIRGNDLMTEIHRKMQEMQEREERMPYGPAVKACVHLATGNDLVVWNPGRDDANEHGCVVEPVIQAFRRDGVVRFIIDRNLGGYYVLSGNVAKFEGFLSDKTLDPGTRAAEGTEFRGWKKTKQYKLTREEIAILITGIVFFQA